MAGFRGTILVRPLLLRLPDKAMKVMSSEKSPPCQLPDLLVRPQQAAVGQEAAQPQILVERPDFQEQPTRLERL